MTVTEKKIWNNTNKDQVEAKTVFTVNHDKRMPEKIDIASRVLFPALFLLFNLIYWPYYLVIIAPTYDH